MLPSALKVKDPKDYNNYELWIVLNKEEEEIEAFLKSHKKVIKLIC